MERGGSKVCENHRKKRRLCGGGMADLRNTEVRVILEMLSVRCKWKNNFVQEIWFNS